MSSQLTPSSPTPTTAPDYNDNSLRNDEVFYALGLDQVWHDGGNWIPLEYRYNGETKEMDWYTYVDVYNIDWLFERKLPSWAIQDMDNYYQEKYYLSSTDENEVIPLTEENGLFRMEEEDDSFQSVFQTEEN
jgi:hypothetical protein